MARTRGKIVLLAVVRLLLPITAEFAASVFIVGILVISEITKKLTGGDLARRNCRVDAVVSQLPGMLYETQQFLAGPFR